MGCGGQGGANLDELARENIIALCDVDENRAAEAFKRFPKAKRFRDYRKMLDAVHAGIDAVVVSIPDHMHAPVSLAAMDLGKHVYCEKPLTWSIDEARRMARVAKEKRLATQMGTQGMASDRARAGIEIIRSGVLGDVTELHVWTDRPTGWWPQGVDRPRDTPAVPSTLDWQLWLGVAQVRPYHPAYCPFAWRGWKDFGTGSPGDMGIHNAAMPFAALELGAVSSAEIIETSELKPETFPAWSRLKLEFAADGSRKPVKLFWYDGGKKPPGSLSAASSLPGMVRLSSGPRERCHRSSGPAVIGRFCRRTGSAISSRPRDHSRGHRGRAIMKNGWLRAGAGRRRFAGLMALRRD